MNIHPLPQDHLARLYRARLALEGLSVGDAFGDGFFGNHLLAAQRLEHRQAPPAPWAYTDDTAMALSIYRCLEDQGRIHREHLAGLFAAEYALDPRRGYGGMAHGILRAIGAGTPWATAAGEAFAGMGSMGNGGAMRVAPLGAYFADDLDELIVQAEQSAEVTHAHPEGKVGAIAVALAAAWAWNHRALASMTDARELIPFVASRLPAGETHSRIQRALDIPFSSNPDVVGQMLGNGSQVTAPDTVAFCLWCAARHAWDFPAALWSTASAMGDVDTTCAIVGGIVALSAGKTALPREWIAARGNIPVHLENYD